MRRIRLIFALIVSFSVALLYADVQTNVVVRNASKSHAASDSASHGSSAKGEQKNPSAPKDDNYRTTYGSYVRVTNKTTGDVTWEDIHGNPVPPPSSEGVMRSATTKVMSPVPVDQRERASSAKVSQSKPNKASVKKCASVGCNNPGVHGGYCFAHLNAKNRVMICGKCGAHIPLSDNCPKCRGNPFSKTKAGISSKKYCASAGCKRSPNTNGFCYEHSNPKKRRVYCSQCNAIIAKQGDCPACRNKPYFENRQNELYEMAKNKPKFNKDGHEFSTYNERQYYETRYANDIEAELAVARMKDAKLRGDNQAKSWNKHMLRTSMIRFHENEARKADAARNGEEWAKEDIFNITPPANVDPGYIPQY